MDECKDLFLQNTCWTENDWLNNQRTEFTCNLQSHVVHYNNIHYIEFTESLVVTQNQVVDD